MRFGLYYFSGCGNTAWVTQKTIEALTRRGHEVVFWHNLEQTMPGELPKTDIDLFLAPIYFAGIPSFVVDKIKALPITGDKKAVFWTVAGQFSGVGRRFGAFMLKDRGYDVLTTYLVRMPDTFLPLAISQISDEEKSAIYQKALQQIEAGLDAIETNTFETESKVSAAFASLLYFPYLYYIRYVMASCFVSTSACIHCGKCERDCPCQVIHLSNGRPFWHKGCTGCFRCVNTCPVAAIDLSGWGVGFGGAGAVIGWLFAWLYLGFLGSILSFIMQGIAFLAGFWAGTFLFQKIYLLLPIEKALLMRGKKRVFVADEEK